MTKVQEFDEYENTYRDAVNSSIGFSGLDVDFFARLKAEDLVALVDRQLGDASAARVLDLGCGVGVTDAYMVGSVGELHGADVSQALLDTASAANPNVRYQVYDGVTLPFDGGAYDATFAVCVLHHVEPGSRAALVREMARVTRPGGLIAIYEHNPFNPLTRLAVSRCEFDEGVELLRPSETRRLLSNAGALPAESRYIAFFPWEVHSLRRLEHGLARVPLGGQYVVAGRVGASGG